MRLIVLFFEVCYVVLVVVVLIVSLIVLLIVVLASKEKKKRRAVSATCKLFVDRGKRWFPPRTGRKNSSNHSSSRAHRTKQRDEQNKDMGGFRHL